MVRFSRDAIRTLNILVLNRQHPNLTSDTGGWYKSKSSSNSSKRAPTGARTRLCVIDSGHVSGLVCAGGIARLSPRVRRISRGERGSESEDDLRG